MEPQEVRQLLKTIGISGGVVLGIFAIGLGFMAYKNYFEVKKIKLEIKKLQKDLA